MDSILSEKFSKFDDMVGPTVEFREQATPDTLSQQSSISDDEIPFADEIVVVPHPQDIPIVDNYPGDLALDFLEPYFDLHRGAVAVGHVFTAERNDGRVVDFCVMSISPGNRARINENTIGSIESRRIGRREMKSLFGGEPSTYAASLQDSLSSLDTTVAAVYSSHSRPHIHPIYTSPHLQYSSTSALGSPISPAFLFKTQSLTEVKDFGADPPAPTSAPVEKSEGTRVRKYFRRGMSRKLFAN